MQQVLTAKLKLQTDPGQHAALRRTQLAYRDALNAVSAYAFTHGKMSNQEALQRACYAEIRATHGLPAQMACNVPRQVGATYKALWAKQNANARARAEGRTKKRYKGLDKPPRYGSPTLTYNYRRDWSLKTQQRVSILTLEGRVVVPYSGYAPHVSLLHQGADVGAARLWYDKQGKTFYLLVSLHMSVPDPKPEQQGTVVGVDVGQRYLAVATDMQNHTAFFSGKETRAHADHYVRLRKRLQRKGTRSAKRRLRAMAGRERRLQRDRNHVISKRIIQRYPKSLMGLEDLTHIRDRTTRKRGRCVSQTQRRANRHASRWSFAELQAMVAYKAVLTGSMATKVDAYQTSQACPRCGHTAEGNRPGKGLLFICEACHMVLHADLVGARNLALRTLLARQDWARTGVLSARPDVSREEAKAAQRLRYAELRWSPDTSPRL
jgi:IS605 OrfB family transposase